MTLVPERRITLGGVPVDVRGFDEAVDLIASWPLAHETTPLAVASINLDHIHHFGTGSKWGTRLSATARQPTAQPTVEWLNLIDGAPIAVRARQIVGENCPRLAGSDLITPLLDRAEQTGASVGFLGGSVETQALLRDYLRLARPGLRISGFWSPARQELSDPDACGRLSEDIAAAKTDILIVGLGKPRQELWIAEYGPATHAQVLLAFGAVVDFLAGRVRRAPQWVSEAGLEWAWRLVLEPRRLARRYLVEGPSALVRIMASKVEPVLPLTADAAVPMVGGDT
ncbi:exopolysaccharide biosynthesis WecB/TagA/CpsF family protein [Okibacterium sp. HSC-33S16]|uniref:WecB/TagA/CpsF family glycosyltransferase n=1 Tax=Okibacterium sp. HSC-33S16 TaxID=2910965 RepID=UPI00209F2067|nr:WecB/TagA/CpsF family glycosyltransferase [Okibacterium sp. HSC-33S16]MCP2031560.1 exopolysaccharide biosynthesis WecB/TagA/CpsF family protein [Okibacterium sp. HSC-33S16]